MSFLSSGESVGEYQWYHFLTGGLDILPAAAKNARSSAEGTAPTYADHPADTPR
jgi:S-formylglutathione hydrolase FrmB